MTTEIPRESFARYDFHPDLGGGKVLKSFTNKEEHSGKLTSLS